MSGAMLLFSFDHRKKESYMDIIFLNIDQCSQFQLSLRKQKKNILVAFWICTKMTHSNSATAS